MMTVTAKRWSREDATEDSAHRLLPNPAQPAAPGDGGPRKEAPVMAVCAAGRSCGPVRGEEPVRSE